MSNKGKDAEGDCPTVEEGEKLRVFNTKTPFLGNCKGPGKNRWVFSLRERIGAPLSPACLGLLG
jgi:hypothetical protein